MRKRITRLIALLMTAVILNQLPGMESLIAYAAEISIYEDTTVSESTDDTYVFASGCTITVNSGVSVGGVSSSANNNVTVVNNGSVSNVSASAGDMGLTSGYYGSVNVESGATVDLNNSTVGSLVSNGTVNIVGTVSATSVNAARLEGVGAITVSSDLTLTGTGTTATLNVDKATVITTNSEDITVNYAGTAYNVEAGSSYSLLSKYGVLVTFQTTDENIDWTVVSETDNLNSKIWPGDTTGTYQCTAVEGYYFPEDYVSNITCNGNGTLNAVRVSESELQVSYTVASSDSADVTITFPALTEVPKTGSGTLAIADTYYGVAVSPKVSSATNSTTGAVVEYKVAGAADSTYTRTVPTTVGSYSARVILPANATYGELVLTDDFSISYLPTPENPYTLSGAMGSNGIYTSSVTVIAKDGYAISTTLDGEYVGQFTITSSKAATMVYFMDESTGAKTAGTLMNGITIDATLPVIDAEDNSTYYADSYSVNVSDSNLASVTVNGEAVTFEGRNTVLDLKSNGGEEEYTIVVTDLAGHSTTIKIIVAAEWTKNGVIPSGEPVKLKNGQSYTLGSGTWTVGGDSTSYSGGSTFYVGGEGQYTFTQQ